MSVTSAPTAPTRFTLRQLPLPAKLVVTLFLMTVGLGYSSAMVQLHMQHSERDGNHLPTPANVVAVFSGKVWRTPDDGAPREIGCLECVISGPPKGGLTRTNMTPAFFEKDDADYRKIAKEHPERVPQLDAERDGERRAVIAWINAVPEARKAAYDGNAFALPPDRAREPISEAYKDKARPGTVLIKSILRDRCTRCHQPGGDKGDLPLTTYEDLTKFMPTAVPVPEGGGYVDSGKQMSLEKLTQSTHAHLLSFAVLFTLTGLTFAFTSYPGLVRGIVGPVVLLAQVADVSCWWLARLPESGPYFALAILATGGVVGLGLGAQIVLSLFNMYGPAGKLVLLLLFAGAGAGGGAAYTNLIDPYLKEEKAKVVAKQETEKKQKADEEAAKAARKDDPAAGRGRTTPVPPPAGPSRLENLLLGEFDPAKKGKWGKSPGGMVRAFYDKDEDVFKPAMEDKSPELARLVDERRGEQALVLAWVKTAPDVRKKAYEDDRFPLPAEWKDKPFTAEFKADDTAVKVKSLLDARCAKCHGSGGDKEDKPLTKYEEFETYFKPAPPAAKE